MFAAGRSPIGAWRRAALLVAGLASSSLAQEGARPVPRLVAETGRGFQSFSAPPAGNGSGAMVFHAVDATGRGVLAHSSGGSPMIVVVEGASLDFGATLEDPLPESYTVVRLGTEPSVSTQGTIVFQVVLDGGQAILAKDGPFGPVSFVADSGEAFRSFSGRVRVDAAGAVMFHATVDPPGHPDRADTDPWQLVVGEGGSDPEKLSPPARWTRRGMQAAYDEGIFLEDGEQILVVGGTDDDFADVSPRFDLAAGGAVAYLCYTVDGAQQVVWDGGWSRPFTLAHTGPAFLELGDPACNDRGDVVFRGRTAEGAPVILHGRNSRLTPRVLARGSDEVDLRPELAVDEFFTCYFVARDGKGRETLIARDQDGSLRPLLRSGDPVPDATSGSWVRRITLSTRPFLRPGAMVLLLDLEPKGRAVVVLEVGRPG